jgi:hypothetical protein
MKSIDAHEPLQREGFAEPDAGIGFAYVMISMGFHIFDDPREKNCGTLYTNAWIQLGSSG